MQCVRKNPSRPHQNEALASLCDRCAFWLFCGPSKVAAAIGASVADRSALPQLSASLVFGAMASLMANGPFSHIPAQLRALARAPFVLSDFAVYTNTTEDLEVLLHYVQVCAAARGSPDTFEFRWPCRCEVCAEAVFCDLRSHSHVWWL